MQATRKLLPGQPGTRKLLDKYGDDLLCVRYRYDPEHKIRMKTIEIIIEKAPWQGTPRRIPSKRIVSIRIEYGEVEVGRRVKAAGGTWNRERKVWELAYGDVVALGLEERVVAEDGV